MSGNSSEKRYLSKFWRQFVCYQINNTIMEFGDIGVLCVFSM